MHIFDFYKVEREDFFEKVCNVSITKMIDKKRNKKGRKEGRGVGTR